MRINKYFMPNLFHNKINLLIKFNFILYLFNFNKIMNNTLNLKKYIYIYINIKKIKIKKITKIFFFIIYQLIYYI